MRFVGSRTSLQGEPVSPALQSTRCNQLQRRNQNSARPSDACQGHVKFLSFPLQSGMGERWNLKFRFYPDASAQTVERSGIRIAPERAIKNLDHKLSSTFA